jgi:plasmid stabilization system protein ParE
MESNKLPIIWSPQSDDDVENVLLYLEADWPPYVKIEFLNTLFTTLDWISSNPHIFIKPNESDSIRKYVMSEYHTLYFEIFDSKIDLLRIFDTRQDPNKLKL